VLGTVLGTVLTLYTVWRCTLYTACVASRFFLQQNFVGWDGQADCTVAAQTKALWGGNVNTPYVNGATSGLSMSNPGLAASAEHNGTLTVAALVPSAPVTTGKAARAAAGAAAVTCGVIAGEADEVSLWQTFVSGGEKPVSTATPTAPSAAGTSYCGGVVQSVIVPAGGTASVTFVLAWHFPNRARETSVGKTWDKNLPAVLGNKYSTWWADANAVASYAQVKFSSGLCTFFLNL
jgi:hypothetical protein